MNTMPALPSLTWHQADLLRPGCAGELVRQVRPDRLLHLAWYAGLYQHTAWLFGSGPRSNFMNILAVVRCDISVVKIE